MLTICLCHQWGDHYRRLKWFSILAKVRCGEEGRVNLTKNCLGRWIGEVAFFMGVIDSVHKRYRNLLEKCFYHKNC